MALELSNFDYDVLDHFLEVVLNEHRAGNLALSEARDAVSERFPWQRSIPAVSPATCRV